MSPCGCSQSCFYFHCWVRPCAATLCTLVMSSQVASAHSLLSLVSVDGCCGSSLNADVWLAAAAGQTSVSRETKLFILCLFEFYWLLEFLHISKLTLHRLLHWVSCIFSVACNLKLRLRLSQRREVFTWQSRVTPEEHIHHRSSCPLFTIHHFWPEFPSISHGGQRLDPCQQHRDEVWGGQPPPVKWSAAGQRDVPRGNGSKEMMNFRLLQTGGGLLWSEGSLCFQFQLTPCRKYKCVLIETFL